MFSRKFIASYLEGFLHTPNHLCKTDAWGAVPACTCGCGGCISSPPPPVLADNLKSNPGIKWQYFSSEEGIFTVFPAHKFRCKGSYEHRSRYVDLACPSFNYCVRVICIKYRLLIHTRLCLQTLVSETRSEMISLLHICGCGKAGKGQMMKPWAFPELSNKPSKTRYLLKKSNILKPLHCFETNSST